MTQDSRSKDMMQRIQIGLTGLAGVVLLVGLANIVINKAGIDADVAATGIDGSPPQVVATTGNAVDSVPEPLAELGVTPPPPDSATQAQNPQTAPGQVVPDLEPNPALNKRMDREP